MNIITIFFLSDVNECKVFQGLCTYGTCRNTIGSFKCRCNNGFALTAEERNCTGMRDEQREWNAFNININISVALTELSFPVFQTLMSAAFPPTCVVRVLVSTHRAALSVNALRAMRAASWWWRTAWVSWKHTHTYSEKTADHLMFLFFQCLPSLFSLSPTSLLTDIDECERNPLLCQGGICHNTEGSYECECPTGYSLSADGSVCEGGS